MAFFQIAKTVIKSLFGKPATLMYPAKPAKITENTRGHITIEEEKCILCGSCQRNCPSDAICVERKDRVWEMDRMRCIACGYCVEVCPVKCLKMENKYLEPELEKKREAHNIPEKPKAPAAKEPA